MFHPAGGTPHPLDATSARRTDRARAPHYQTAADNVLTRKQLIFNDIS